MKTVIKYQLSNGKIPFDEWFAQLDKPMKAKVLVRIERLKIGLYGNYRNLKKGISELKFENGSRIYFYECENTLILLINCGNKQRQSDDIQKAELYLIDYKERTNINDKNA